MPVIEDEISDLISSYHELNAESIEELNEEPSALEFMRYVARNRPFVIRGGAREWNALLKWNSEYLAEVMAGQSVKVAMTPLGNADSVLECDDGSTLFIKPYECDLNFEDALGHIIQLGTDINEGPVCYCQTQNDNLRNEYESLFKDVPKSVPFARIALQQEPDAINFWMGNSRSVTALHKDPYENIYVQVLGQKHFVLLPPIESACIDERMHPAATYEVPDHPPSTDFRKTKLYPVLDQPPALVPFANWDPDSPQKNATRFSYLNRPMRVTLDPGDMLYLPALWYHKVSQSCSEEGICCAVNYWYDIEYSGSFYPLSTFARRIGLLATKSNVLSGRVAKEAKGGNEAVDDEHVDILK